MLDTALEAKVLANKDESKCFKPLIAVVRPVRDRYEEERKLANMVRRFKETNWTIFDFQNMFLKRSLCNALY